MPLGKKTITGIEKLRLTLSCAESCTGGRISASITENAGASKYFKGGIISYSDEAKIQILKVRKSTIRKFGAVSRETAKEMAEGAAGLMKSDISVSATGIAGPSGALPGKPRGLVFFALFFRGGTETFRKVFRGNRRRVQASAAEFALSLISKKVKSLE